MKVLIPKLVNRKLITVVDNSSSYELTGIFSDFFYSVCCEVLGRANSTGSKYCSNNFQNLLLETGLTCNNSRIIGQL